MKSTETPNDFLPLIEMIRRTLALLILFSMVLHSASRLGVLSYLYKNRNEIATTIGLISEVPIALCSSDYDFNEGLTIQVSDDRDHTMPPVAFQAKEIQLFFDSAPIHLTPRLAIVQTNKFTAVVERLYFPPAISIFHPPS